MADPDDASLPDVVPGVRIRDARPGAKQGWADEGDFTHHAPVGVDHVEVLCRRYTKRLT